MPLIRTQSFIFHENGSWNEPSMLLTPPTPNPPSPGTVTYTAASTVMLATTQHVTTTVSGPATSGSIIPTLALAPLSISPALPIPGLPIINQGFPRRSSPLGPRPRVLSHHPAFPRSGPKPNLYRLALMIRSAKAAAKNPSAGPVRARILSLPNVSACQAETEYPSFGSYSWFGESHQD